VVVSGCGAAWGAVSGAALTTGAGGAMTKGAGAWAGPDGVEALAFMPVSAALGADRVAAWRGAASLAETRGKASAVRVGALAVSAAIRLGDGVGVTAVGSVRAVSMGAACIEAGAAGTPGVRVATLVLAGAGRFIA
jgi:hypothetical protein